MRSRVSRLGGCIAREPRQRDAVLPEGVAIDEHGRPTTDAAMHALGVSAEYLLRGLHLKAR